MRKLLFTLATVGALGAYGSAQAADLTIVSWGGAYSMSQKKAYIEPYIAKTGLSIDEEVYNGGLAEIRAQVESGNVTWDLIDAELSDAIRGCDEGILEPIDASMLPAAPDGTPASEDFLEGSITECAVPTIVWSTIFAYDTSRMPNGPGSLADFFDTAKFPGKRGLRNNPKATLEMALFADGVAAGDIYEVLATPEGVDRAFAKLDSIKDDVIWWTAGAQPPQLLADGEVVMTTAYNGRIFNAAAAEGKPFEIVWDGQVFDLDLWVVPRGAPNTDKAMKFIAYSTDTQRLADQASYISYGPARMSSAPLVGKYHDKDIDMGPQMPTAPENFKTAIKTDPLFWADNQDELNERFNAWLAS
jgi:putative spermidine/putrescine transport system substrate-binding protein